MLLLRSTDYMSGRNKANVKLASDADGRIIISQIKEVTWVNANTEKVGKGGEEETRRVGRRRTEVTRTVVVRFCFGRSDVHPIAILSSIGSSPKNLGIRVDWESIQNRFFTVKNWLFSEIPWPKIAIWAHSWFPGDEIDQAPLSADQFCNRGRNTRKNGFPQPPDSVNPRPI